jgi:hypothetical protein
MPIDLGTKNSCRYCNMVIEYRHPVDREGAAVDWVPPKWYHVDERPLFLDEDGSGRYDMVRLKCDPHNVVREEQVAWAEPRTVCNYDLKSNYAVICGRKIPPENIKEGIYACGTHARYEREAQAMRLREKLRQEEKIAEGDLRAWARDQIGKKVATIIEAGLPVKWKSGLPETKFGSRYEQDPEMVVTVNVDDMLEWIHDHNG